MLVIAFSLFVVTGICWLLVGVTINFPQKSPRQKLDEARALWHIKGSQDYQMDIIFSSFSISEGYRIVVRDNQVTDISGFLPLYMNVTPTPLKSNEETLAESNYVAQKISPNLKEYTVDGLFEIAATKVSNDAPLVTWCSIDTSLYPDVRFNAEYGYIESYDLGNCPKWDVGAGLMCPVISDCWAFMRVRNIQPLPPT